MEKQMLMYERAVPVSKERHKNWHIQMGGDFGFAKEINLSPLLTTEFVKALREYPIIFVETNGTILPAAALGLRDQENLFVTDQKGWDARYIPAFIRRYPFVFSYDKGGSKFTLCFDEDYSGCNEEGEGEPLFNEDGEPSEYLRRMLGFLQTYQRDFEVTRAFCERLKSLEVLSPGAVKFEAAGRSALTTKGMLAVDRKKLQEIPKKQIPALLEAGDLEIIYAHLFSLANLERLGRRLNMRLTNDGT